jgi:BirA family biotin operon repressor/biotin-[acetyl-CoA-carboxylase] ligase
MGGRDSIRVSRFKIHSFDTLDSTQTLAKQWAEEGKISAGDVIFAKKQTAAYGRRARTWQMPEGNLAVTWAEDFSHEKLSQIGFAVSLGLYDAFREHLPDAEIKLKWPNDVLIAGGKASGILIEVANDKLLIGVGVNLAEAPQADQKTAAVADFASAPDAAEFLQKFLIRYDHWVFRDFSEIRSEWLRHAHGLNAPLTARLADGREITGVFTALDPLGALLLNTPSGLEKVTSADIFIR